MIAALAAAAIGVRRSRRFRGFSFTFSVFTFVAAAMFYPAAFRSWGGFELSRLIVPLIQIIMFGMGVGLSVEDFARALKMPKAVG
ncbi:MAG: bile acid:sodium symporter family protein, partial [Bryobacteraceae bacterium]|nr:bile acid:sodium symporter family protein [Bryobacteraceae bacterium]